MSRFFANNDEEEEEIKEELQNIEEEPTKKKKKKKKKKKNVELNEEEKLKKEEKLKQDLENKKKKKKNKKKNKGAALALKKLEEKKKREMEEKIEARAKFYKLVMAYNKLDFDLIIDSIHAFRKKFDQKQKRKDGDVNYMSRKEREKHERAEMARLQFEKMNMEFEKKFKPVKDDKRAEGGLLRKKKRKKKNKKKQSEIIEEKVEEKITKTETKAETQEETLELDNWENLLLEEEPEKAPKAPEKLPEKQKKKPSPKKEEILEVKKDALFAGPMDYFNFKCENRCPIICIMGHVDTGKTKILDHIRNTNVQLGEAGGITQQIGATFFPNYKLQEEVIKLDKKVLDITVNIPGFLVIDTPGHESFANLRSRGSSLCDLAIVVIDVMHSLEKQTIESLNLLIERKTPFVIALNKVDRLHQWKSKHDGSSYKSLKRQIQYVKNIFEERLLPVKADLMKLGINSELYWKNPNPKEYISIVPTSAITGEGLPDLLGYLAWFSQTYQKKTIKKNNEIFKATVLEVKKIEGMGATIDVILVNGELKVDDKIILSGFDGVIETSIKAILTPHPMKEMRVKNEFLHHKSVEGSMGIKLMCQGLERALAGSSLYKIKSAEEKEEFSVFLQDDIKKIKKKVKLKKEGVGVAASTLGSLEALLNFLKASKIPVSTVCIGDVSKKEMLRVLTPFVQDENRCKKTEFLTMLCFDVKLLPDARKFAEDNKIKIIQAKIIYHLFGHFSKHVQAMKLIRKKEEAHKAIFPCVLRQIQCFNKKDPLIIGVDIIKGVLKPGTPICVPSKGMVKIGIVESIQMNKKSIPEARKKNGSVAVRIKGDSSILHGRHFDLEDDLVSILTRKSIDVLKEHFRDEMLKEDWNLVRKLKGVFDIC